MSSLAILARNARRRDASFIAKLSYRLFCLREGATSEGGMVFPMAAGDGGARPLLDFARGHACVDSEGVQVFRSDGAEGENRSLAYVYARVYRRPRADPRICA